MNFDALTFNDKKSLTSNKFNPVVRIPVRKGTIKLIRLRDEINVVHFDDAGESLLFQHETDGRETNLLADLVKDIPIGNRKDLVNSPFRDAFFQEPNAEEALALMKGDHRALKFIGEDGDPQDTIDSPFGHFVFEASLKGLYKENPAREGMPNNLEARFCVYKKKDAEDEYLVILELATPSNLDGGLIYVFTARSIKTSDIK